MLSSTPSFPSFSPFLLAMAAATFPPPDIDLLMQFRFSYEEIMLFGPLLHLPEVFYGPNCYQVPWFKGLCLVLYHMSWPLWLSDAKNLFVMSKSFILMMFHCILQEIYICWKDLLLFDHVCLMPQFLAQCAEPVQDHGSLVPNVFAFMDGTHMCICHPTEDQEEYYSSQKHFHSIKYQAIITPDGIMVLVGGPFSSCWHDSCMANDLQIQSFLAKHARSPTGAQMVVYGDEGYGQSDEIKAPFRGNILTPEQATHNESMWRPWLCAEWSFGYMSNNFGLINYYQKFHMHLLPIGLYFPTSSLFCNVLWCFGCGSTTLSHYQMAAPTPQEYLTPQAMWQATRVVHVESVYFEQTFNYNTWLLFVLNVQIVLIKIMMEVYSKSVVVHECYALTRQEVSEQPQQQHYE